MPNQSEDTQAAGFDTRPPMLDKTDFESCQKRIWSYCKGKDHGEYILQSIDEGSFKMRKCRDEIASGLDGLPKDIYKLINHNTYAKDIRDNVKMLLKGSVLTKDYHESQLYDEFEYFEQYKGETIHAYYVRVVVQNIQGRQNKVQGNNARGNVAAGNRGAQNKASNANVGKESKSSDMAQNKDSIFQADQCDAFDSDVDEAPTAQILFMANLSSPIYDEVGPSYDSDTLSEAKALKEKAKSTKPNIAMTMYHPNTPAKLVPKVFLTESQVQVRVKGATAVSGSKPKSNTKKDRTLPAKSDPKKVEVHPRNNKSSVK
nr:hypothetical protein [Tanacetum cinerariifolium]